MEDRSPTTFANGCQSKIFLIIWQVRCESLSSSLIIMVIVNYRWFVRLRSLLLVIVNDVLNLTDSDAGQVGGHVPVKSHEENMGPHLSNWSIWKLYVKIWQLYLYKYNNCIKWKKYDYYFFYLRRDLEACWNVEFVNSGIAGSVDGFCPSQL